MLLASSEDATRSRHRGFRMSDAIVEAFNDAATWEEALAAIKSNAVALLDAAHLKNLDFLAEDPDREQALGLSVNETRTLFGAFTSLTEIKTLVERQIDVEYAKYEFVLYFSIANTPEDMRVPLERVQLLHDDRESIIQEWSSNDDPAVRERAVELAAEPYTIVLRTIAARLADGLYLDALAAEMMSAHQEHGPFDDLDDLIQALDDATDALEFGSIISSFNEAEDWDAMLVAIKEHASALLDANHLGKLTELSD